MSLTRSNPVQNVLLVLNAGSATLKFSLYAADTQPGPESLLYSGLADGIGATLHLTIHDAQRQLAHTQTLADNGHAAALQEVLRWLQTLGVALVAVGHRVVHGGGVYSGPVRVDHKVLQELEQWIPLAPLHQPHNLAAIKALQQLQPQLAQVASFDTAFHRQQSDIATRYALPERIVQMGVRRYGFHGLSYAYIASRLDQQELLGAQAKTARVIVAHLGSGASLCALQGGKSVVTTMGMSALDGLVMSHRPGQLDPGVLLFLLRSGMSTSDLEHLLYHASGLLGMAGDNGDMRQLLKREAQGDHAAHTAIAVFLHRLRGEIGAMTAALGGVDALVFTAGIGEHAAVIRARIVADAAWLGLQLDADANAQHALRIAAPHSRIPIFVIPTDEAVVIARETWGLWDSQPDPVRGRRGRQLT